MPKSQFVCLAMLGLAVHCAFAQTTPPLNFFKNYFVTGDYVVGGIGLRGLGDATGYATGAIQIPDPNSVPATGVPAGADIVAAFLYWQTVEKAQSTNAGQNGFFNGYAITGTQLGNPNAPVSWSAGGCAGSSNGTTTLRTYRSDVRPFLNVVNGAIQGNGSYTVRLADSGSNGGGTPLTLGASLILVYRVKSAAVPLGVVTIYDGAYAPGNASASMVQQLQGFYQASTAPVAKLTHIVGNGQPNKSEQVSAGSVTLPSLYANLPAFPGYYNQSWDNPTWVVNQYGNAVNANDAAVTTSVVPAATNSGCVSWSAVVGSVTVQNTTQDGLLDVWKANQGYTDVANGQAVSLPSPNTAGKDIYVQVDWLASHDYITSSGTMGHTHKPKQAAIDMVGDAFAAQGIQLHVDCGGGMYGCYSTPDKYVVPFGAGGNVIDENTVTCTDNATVTPPVYCQFPGVPAVMWKGGFTALKNKYFQHGRKDSYHYVLFAHELGLATNIWAISDGSLVSIGVSNNTATVTTAAPHNLLTGARVSVSGAISTAPVFGADFALDGTYPSITVTGPTTFTFPTTAPAGVYTTPWLFVSSGLPRSTSGWSDLAGRDTVITLGLWHSDNSADDQVGSALVQAGTLAHEIGHTLGLRHGGGDNVNCKSNYESVMNYLDQVRGLTDYNGVSHVDYSGQVLPNLNETSLIEANGIGAGAMYQTRWYGPLSFLDKRINSLGGRAASRHCDGTLITDGAQMVRTQGPFTPGAIDWNGNGTYTDAFFAQDLSFNGFLDTSFSGYNDWTNIDLRQIGAGQGAFGFSGDVWGTLADSLGGTLADSLGGTLADSLGGTLADSMGGTLADSLGGTLADSLGGAEDDFTQANSTVDSPLNLTGSLVSKSVVLNWTAPAFGQIRTYYIWRADITKAPMSPTNLPSQIGKVTGTPPQTTFTDSVKNQNNSTFLYFVTAALGTDSGPNAGNQSGPSNMVTVVVKF